MKRMGPSCVRRFCRPCPVVMAFWLCLGWVGVAAANDQVALVFLRNDGRYWQVWTSDIQGRNPIPVTDTPVDKRLLDVMQGEGSVLFRDNHGKVFRVPLGEDKPAQRVLEDVEVVKDLDYHRQAGYLLSTYAPNAKDNIRIWWHAIDGTDRRLLIPDPFLNESPRWLANGESFLFVKTHEGHSSLCRSSLLEPEAVHILGKEAPSSFEPCPNPAGTRMVYCRKGRGGIDLWMADLEGKAEHELYAGEGLDTEPCWSPDGDWIAFSTWDGENFRLAKIRPDGSDMSLISPPGVDSRSPLFLSMDGEAADESP